jgi:hypothetical protein
VKALGISAPVGPRRKYPKSEPRECRTCGETFTPKDASQDVRGHGHYCTPLCARRSPESREGGRWSAQDLHARADKALAQTNAAGYLTMRQAAAEVGIAESTLHRYAERSFLKIGGRRKVEGEWWRLVSREELERFKADEWPALRRQHAEMRLQDVERGYPRMPSTWGGEARKRNGRRRDSLRKRSRRYTTAQAAEADRLLLARKSIRKTQAKPG